MEGKFKLLIAAAVLGTGTYLLLKKGVRPPKGAVPVAVATDQAPAKRAQAAPPAPKGYSKEQNNFMEAMAAGLQPFSYAADSRGGKVLRVTIKPQWTCHLGDYEAIALATKKGSVLLSLEPMEGRGNIVKKEVSLKDLLRGRVMDLPVDAGSGRLYGLYLCGDDGNLKACSGKKAVDVEGILRNQATAEAHVNSVFFYQLMVLDEGSGQLYGGDAKNLPELGKVLDHRGTSDRNVDKTLATAGAIMGTVRSEPMAPTVSGGQPAVSITVPYLAADRCGMVDKSAAH